MTKPELKKLLQEQYDFFIFDLYGTLILLSLNEEHPDLWHKLVQLTGFRDPQTGDQTGESLRRFYLSECRRLSDFYSHHSSYPDFDIREVFEAILRNSRENRSSPEKLALHFRTLAARKLALYRGAEDYLSSLKHAGKKIFLLCNGQRLFSEAELTRLGIIGYFDGLYFSSDFHSSKPDPEFFRHLLLKENLDPERTLMIGNDHTTDIAGARACGIDSLYLHTSLSRKLKEQSIGETGSTYGWFKGGFFRNN